ncbi:MAG TPA: glycoside hydrolase family 18 [Chitinophaga sp.]|uniref:glycoside hydrolase family 18 n=1 Tax=Chitinophaga sp. TaxID=1869181 RepID=UPI002BDA7F5C|nr:glycoside hydrolase family 18 [Chitinophaga sp.]HVI43934.1 glycoside hydrolase family 18 [Chitinophaga sp.]
MYRLFPSIFFLISVALLIQGCTKEKDAEALSFDELNPVKGSEQYYEALRAYKKSDHAVCFGWWGGSGVSAIDPDMTTRYEGLPDSMDIVSLWGGIPTDPAVHAEMQSVRQRKGTRFVLVIFGSGVDNLRKKNFPNLPVLTSIDSVAKSIADTVAKYNIDGFDLDYEPNYGDGGIFGHGGGGRDDGGDVYTQRLFKALSKYMGPVSGTGKLLIIDGENERGIEPYIDYLAQQAYGSSSFSALDSRYRQFGFDGVLPPRKFIVTENMQQYGGFGTTFNYNGVNIGSVTGMAMWNPSQGRKGGFGGYIIESDARSKTPTTYFYLRNGIQIQNPAPVK